MEERLSNCPHCGMPAKYVGQEKGRHIFWHVSCTSCGCSTWRDTAGYGHMDNAGRALAAMEWNSRH